MKSISNKKKNSQKDHSLNDLVKESIELITNASGVRFIGPNGPIRYEPSYTQPPGIMVTCHFHNPPVGFKSIAESQIHDLEVHQNKHGL